jgi:hypothetical protein
MKLLSLGARRRLSSAAATGAAAARPRVGSIVDLGEVLKIEVSVDLGGRDVGMSEKLLNPAQIPARLE